MPEIESHVNDTQNSDDGATPVPVETTAGITQADVDRVVKERVNRERAKYADYEKLKADAAKLREIETADLSAQEKAEAAVAEARAEAEAAKADVSRFRAAATHGIAGDDIQLIGGGTDDEVEDRAKRIGSLLAAERELADLKKAQADAGKQPAARPVQREWQPGATPVSVNGGPTAKDRAAAQARALGWVQSNNS